MKSRYHRIDGWRGYSIPGAAVAGASDTGTWEDSPCPSPKVAEEVRKFQRECLRPLGIKSRTRYGHSSNVFCGKRWIVVKEGDYERAKAAAVAYLKQHDRELQYLHDAD